MSEQRAGARPLSIPEEIWREMEDEVERAGGPYAPSPVYENAVGRTMFDLPTSE